VVKDALTTAFIAGGAAIAGGLLNGAYQHLRDHHVRPKLVIDFEGTAANMEEVEYKDGDRVASEIYIRARVRNTGRQVAKRCRIFVASLAEVHPSGVMPTRLHDAKQLAWAGYDFSPLDVPPGVDFYADIARVSKDNPGITLSVQRLFASQAGIRNYRGIYRFRLLATADNADPSECAIDVSYDGDWHNLRALKAKAWMKIQSVELRRFKRFHHLKIELPDDVKLVILAGPNGSGKSSLFEAFHFWHRMGINKNPGWDESYYPKIGEPAVSWNQHVSVEFHGAPVPVSDQEGRRKLFYIRSAYRNDPQFELPSLSRQGDATEEFRFARLIDNDVAVAKNYQRFASRALQDAFAGESPALTLGEFREKTIGDIRAAMKRVFPDLLLNDLGDPLVSGTFHFDKGTSRHYFLQEPFRG
jgi:hypothetical protein